MKRRPEGLHVAVIEDPDVESLPAAEGAKAFLYIVGERRIG